MERTSHPESIVDNQRDAMIVSDLCVKDMFVPWKRWKRRHHTLASAGRSNITYFGLPIVSTKIALVFSLIALANASGEVSVTQLMPIPNFLNVTMRNVETQV